jgi:hypothetical protein
MVVKKSSAFYRLYLGVDFGFLIWGFGLVVSLQASPSATTRQAALSFFKNG